MSSWPAILGLTTSALMLGGLAVPASRKLLNNQLQADWLENELEFEAIEDDDTIVTKNRQISHLWHLNGVAYESRNEQEQAALLTGRAAVLKDLSDMGLSFRFFGRKRLKKMDLNYQWPSAGLQEIGNAEADYYDQAFIVDWYILLSCKDKRKLNEGSSRLRSVLSGYQPTQVKNTDDQTPLTDFVNYLICGETSDHYLPYKANLSCTLPASDLNFEKTGTLTTQAPNTAYWRFIAIKQWPEEVSGLFIQEMLGLNIEMEISHACIYLSSAKARWDFKRKSNQYALASFVSNGNIAAEYVAADELLVEDSTAFYDTQFSIAIRNKDIEKIEDDVQAIADILGRLRISFNVETQGAPLCWFNRHPTHDKLLRPLRLNVEAISAMWPLPQSVKGLEKSAFGQGAVRVFRTTIGTAYNLQFHNSDRPQSLGHFMVFAPSNSGKSTLMMHLFGGLAKYQGVRSYVFDSKEGVRFMMEAMGGLYQTFDKLSLNPLDVGMDTKQNRQRIRLVLQSMLGNLELTPKVEQEINHAVDISFSIDPPNRTLNNLFPAAFSVVDDGDSEVKQAFKRWVTTIKGESGAYSHIFNAAHDSLAHLLGGSFMVGINMNEALDDPILGAPIVTHISQSISKSAAQENKGFAIFIDEAAKLLQNQGFKNVVAEMYREYRKLNGLVGMAFQDPTALAKSGLMDAAMDNTAALFFFPNPQGRFDDYAQFNLREEELGFILGGSGQMGGRRCLLIKNDPATQNREAVILDIDLAPLGEAVRFFRSGTDAVKMMVKAQEQHGARWIEEI